MFRIFLLSFCLIVNNIFSQDAAVINITAPVSGCALTSTETVTIKVFNYGSDITTPFDVSYTIDGGAPITETINTTILSNSTYTYSFATKANLSIPGTYNIDAYTTLPGDINPTNDAYNDYLVTSDAMSVGGTVSGPSSVCYNNNSGAVTLSGHTGAVQNWEYSVDNGTTWIFLSNTSTSQSYSNLTVRTLYRAAVKNGSCPVVYSSALTINIDPTSVGGTVSANATVCQGSNSGTLTLSGKTGNVQRWEFSTDGGATWTPIANTGTSQTYTNLTVTTRYRAVVKSGTCAEANSSFVTITVSPPTVGGSVAASDTVCSGSNSGTLTLSGHTGSILRWEYSINGGSTWTNIANTTNKQNYLNLTTSTRYRALVRSGGCPAAYSSPATITVDAQSVGGTVSGSATVCSGTNGDTLNLSGHLGSVVNWELSEDAGATWTVIPNTTTKQAYTNLITTTRFRAWVQNGVCTPIASSAATITVDSVSSGGTTSGSATVCSGSNSGTVTLSGYRGNIVNWLSSTNGGTTWNSISNTTTSLNYSNLSTTTLYAVVVKNSICSADTSTITTITVDPVTVGGSVSGSTTVCGGSNSGVLNLNGYIGSILSWEYSTDGGFTWITISNTTSTQNYNNIPTTTLYRALVKSGECAQAYSTPATITVNPETITGTIYGGTTVCSGSNNGFLNLVGNNGTIIGWESSTDGGNTWNFISNTTSIENYVNLISTTYYRAFVKSGSCAADTTPVAIVNVDAATVGGMISESDTVCYGSNSGVLNLSGHVGTVTGWQVSNDDGITWLSLANTSTSQAYNNLLATTSYRATVKSGVCNTMTSSSATIKVDARSQGGNLTGGTTACADANSGTLTLTGFTGTILGWESSNNGTSWSDLMNTANTYSYTNLDTTTYFHVRVKNGVCAEDTSSIATIIVDPASVGGTVTSSDTVCYGINSGTIALSGNLGSIKNWEYSIDGGGTWQTISSTSPSLTYTNLTITTMYRASVQNGVCNPATSSSVTISVNPRSVAGQITGGTSTCEGANTGTLSLKSFVGTQITWESSTDFGVTWTNLNNNVSSYTYSNLNSTTYFRTIVRSGVCPPDTSDNLVITIFPKPRAGFSSNTVCTGNGTMFSDTSLIGSGYIQFRQWDFGDNDASIAKNPTHYYNAAGSYNVILSIISDKGCSDTARAVVIVTPLPNAEINTGGTTTVCKGDNLILSAPAGYSYLWNTNSITQSISVSEEGEYSVIVTDTLSGCKDSSMVEISVNPAATAGAGKDTTVSLGTSIVLVGSGGTDYEWSPSKGLNNAFIANPVATPLETTDYILTVTNQFGCTDKDTVTIKVIKDFEFTTATLFTPNGDGFNDTWFVDFLGEYPNNEVAVFNRYGKEVFRATGYKNNWDGTYNGSVLPDGTYYYIVTFGDSDNVERGAVTILKGE